MESNPNKSFTDIKRMSFSSKRPSHNRPERPRHDRKGCRSVCKNEQSEINEILKDLKHYKKDRGAYKNLPANERKNEEFCLLSRLHPKDCPQQAGELTAEDISLNAEVPSRKPRVPTEPLSGIKALCGNLIRKNEMGRPKSRAKENLLKKPKNFYSKGYISKLLNEEYSNNPERENGCRKFPINSTGALSNKVISQEFADALLKPFKRASMDFSEYLQDKNTTKSTEKTIRKTSIKGAASDAQHCIEYDSIPIRKQMDIAFDHSEQTVEDLHTCFVTFYQKAKVALRNIETKGKEGNGGKSEGSIISVSESQDSISI